LISNKQLVFMIFMDKVLAMSENKMLMEIP